jgi:hypothetical protein
MIIPQALFVAIGVNRTDCIRMGLTGCSLQLDDTQEYSWAESEVLLDFGRREVRTFLRIQGVSFAHTVIGTNVRISVLAVREYFHKYYSIEKFLGAYDKNRVLRLGSRYTVNPWDLDSRDSIILRMEDSEFNRIFISDPRKRLTTAEILRNLSLHSPVLRGEPPAWHSCPASRGWI